MKKAEKKLALNKMTILHLTENQMNQKVGGLTHYGSNCPPDVIPTAMCPTIKK
jgi:hypothetical protein